MVPKPGRPLRYRWQRPVRCRAVRFGSATHIYSHRAISVRSTVTEPDQDTPLPLWRTSGIQGIPSGYLAVHDARWFGTAGYMEQACETKHMKPTNAAKFPHWRAELRSNNISFFCCITKLMKLTLNNSADWTEHIKRKSWYKDPCS